MMDRPLGRRGARVGAARYGGSLPAEVRPGAVGVGPFTGNPSQHKQRDAKGGARMVVLRREIGDVLRDARQRQGRTLREVSSAARVSLGYLSEVERGQKEASSELLSSICDALDVPMSLVLREVSDRIAVAEGLLIPDTVPVDLAAAVSGRSWDGHTWESSRGELAPVG